MRREGSCPCGAVRYAIEGAVRDVLVCHCAGCCDATGGPWAASAARRGDLAVADESALAWERAAVSEHGASRGSCHACGMMVFWDAAGRDTVSFAVATLADRSGLELAGHIWVGDGEQASLPEDGVSRYATGLPSSVIVPWRV